MTTLDTNSDTQSPARYDCTEQVFGIVDYCVHFMSRTPTMQPEKLVMLQVNLPANEQFEKVQHGLFEGIITTVIFVTFKSKRN